AKATSGRSRRFARSICWTPRALSLCNRRKRTDAAAEVVDRLAQTIFQHNLRFPAKDRFGLSDVRAPLARIILRQRLILDRKLRIHSIANLLGKFENGHLARVAQIDRVSLVRRRQPYETVDEIAHVAKAARLRSVTIDGERLAAQRLVDERGY